MSVAEISAAMGAEPDTSYERGSVSPNVGVTRSRSTWSMNLDLESGAHRGTEALSAAVERLGLGMAERAASLAGRDCEVVLSVHQKLRDDPVAVGLHLTRQALYWLATAAAVLDVDQY